MQNKKQKGERVEFTSKMKDEYTILAPDIFPLHTQLLAEIFRMHGYKFEIMHYQGKEVIQKALESIHNDMCYPLICTAGQALYALECGDYDKHKTALMFFQTGGGCRASNYLWLVRKALENRGMGYVPVISLSFNNIEKNSGFKLNLSILLKGIASIVYSDMLMLLSNQTRPYECKKGESDELVKMWIKRLSSQFATTKKVFGKKIKENLHAIAESFKDIKIKKEKKVKVGIIGEIYVKYSPFGNNNLEKFLQSEDCEVMIPGVFPFIEYCFYNKISDHKSYAINSSVSIFFYKRLLDYCKKIDKVFINEVSSAGFTPPSSFDELVKNSQEVFDTHIEMGEGWLLPSEAVELAQKGYENIISTQPFGCLPNHIVARGFSKRFKGLYPSSYLCAIDYDSSQSVVNQENRIRLMLSLAREKL